MASRPVRPAFDLRTGGAHGVTRPTKKFQPKKLAGKQKMAYVESA